MQTIDQLFTGCERPPKGCIVLEPFVGDGLVLNWIGTDNIIIPYDADPKQAKVLKRDALREKPKYYGTYVYTRCPQLAKADSEDKTLFEKYGVDDLYKCFIKCLKDDTPNGGIIVVPTKFMSGIRDSEIKRRQEFFRNIKPLRFNVFDEKTLVINFRKRMPEDYMSWEEWSFHYYPDHTLNKVKVRSDTPQSFPLLPVCSHEAGKNITVIILNAGTKIDKQLHNKYMVLDLELVTKENSGSKAGLYKTGEQPTGCVIYIRGFLSKKLQARLQKDFNQLLANHREDKSYELVPATNIDSLAAQEVIKSLIVSYQSSMIPKWRQEH